MTAAPALVTALAPLDDILAAHGDVLGGDFAGYRNHAYRVANICAALSAADPVALHKIAIAAALHDLGIWTTAPRLPAAVGPPRDRASRRAGLADWTAEITAMILQHHKFGRWQGPAGWLVEPFRRADWADVTRGVLARGVPRGLIGALYATWPSAGFHRRLVSSSSGSCAPIR